jgi:hypothetical protein
MTRAHERNVAFLKSVLPEYEDPKDGVTGLLDASGNLIPDAAQNLDSPLTWVRLEGGRGATALVNHELQRSAAGFPVQTAINRRTGRREILGIHEDAYLIYSSEVIDRVRNPDGGLTPSDSLLMGKVEPSERGGLWIFVRGFQLGGVTFPVAAEDAHYELDAEVAALSSSMGALALVYIDPADNAIHVEVGDEHGLAYTYSQADADAITLPANAYPLAGLVIQDGQTLAADSFVPFVRYFDRRIWLNPAGAAGTLLLDDGAVGTPSLTFTADTDTGLYRVDDNELGIAAGGARIGTFTLTSGGARNLIIGDGTNTGNLFLDSAAGETSDVGWQRGGVSRFNFRLSNVAETGSNAGSDFFIQTRADDGSILATVFGIKRSNGFTHVGGTGGSAVSPLTLTVSVSATNTITTLFTQNLNTSGTAAQGFGGSNLMRLESSTTADQVAARTRVFWLTATHAARESRLVDAVVTVSTETDVLGQTIDGVDVSDTQAYYFGRPDAAGDWANNTWRMIRSGNDLVIQRRESAAWVTKSTIAA